MKKGVSSSERNKYQEAHVTERDKRIREIMERFTKIWKATYMARSDVSENLKHQ